MSDSFPEVSAVTTTVAPTSTRDGMTVFANLNLFICLSVCQSLLLQYYWDPFLLWYFRSYYISGTNNCHHSNSKHYSSNDSNLNHCCSHKYPRWYDCFANLNSLSVICAVSLIIASTINVIQSTLILVF